MKKESQLGGRVEVRRKRSYSTLSCVPQSQQLDDYLINPVPIPTTELLIEQTTPQLGIQKRFFVHLVQSLLLSTIRPTFL